MKFKIDDRVKIVSGSSNYDYIGLTGRITHADRSYEWRILLDNGRVWYATSKELEKIGGSMSKYEDLKQRIEALDNGWDKKAADVILKMGERIICRYILYIPLDDSDNSELAIFNRGFCETRPMVSFNYSSQREKMEAFKKALLWLLDQSDIKKDIVGTKQQVKIEGKVYEAEIVKEVK